MFCDQNGKKLEISHRKKKMRKKTNDMEIKKHDCKKTGYQ